MKTIAVRLMPKASSNRIGEVRSFPDGEDRLIVYVTAVAEGGKANQAMIRLLAEHFNTAASRIHIIQGMTSRNKRIRIL